MNFNREKTVDSKIVQGPYGTPDMMLSGFSRPQDLTMVHPLEQPLKNYHKNVDKSEFTMLRNTQGLHAPLRLIMERKAAIQVNRLPFLPSSNVMLDTLTGNDEMITFEDILNDPKDCETMVCPHLAMERALGFA